MPSQDCRNFLFWNWLAGMFSLNLKCVHLFFTSLLYLALARDFYIHTKLRISYQKSPYLFPGRLIQQPPKIYERLLLNCKKIWNQKFWSIFLKYRGQGQSRGQPRPTFCLVENQDQDKDLVYPLSMPWHKVILLSHPYLPSVHKSIRCPEHCKDNHLEKWHFHIGPQPLL